MSDKTVPKEPTVPDSRASDAPPSVSASVPHVSASNKEEKRQKVKQYSKNKVMDNKLSKAFKDKMFKETGSVLDTVNQKPKFYASYDPESFKHHEKIVKELAEQEGDLNKAEQEKAKRAYRVHQMEEIKNQQDYACERVLTSFRDNNEVFYLLQLRDLVKSVSYLVLIRSQLALQHFGEDIAAHLESQVHPKS